MRQEFIAKRHDASYAHADRTDGRWCVGVLDRAYV
ncbi:hypothetical protein bAD24_III13970 [Burkholderia sp. AD24]|nr:hypothetical protein bAD24_III13970 [Burkholderia sp. AD24]